MSFLKQEPPKPTLARRNFGPMRLSVPMARAISSTSAPVASHNSDMLLIELMRWARKALATSLDSSLDQTLVVRMRSRGIQRAYTSTSFCRAAWPLAVSWLPISTRSGCSRSAIAVPSARNSGFDSTSNRTLPPLLRKMRSIASAVRTGRVLFSTTILSVVACCRIWRATRSKYCRSEARPAPWPNVLVGVLTQTKITSASAMALGVSVEKNRLRPSAARTTSARPGS